MSVIWTDKLPTLGTLSGSSTGQAAVSAGAWTEGDGGGGLFYWSPSADGGAGTGDWGVTIPAPGGTWKRVYSGAINVRWYGTLMTTGDATAAINAAIAAATQGGAGAVYFPAGTYLMGSPPQPPTRTADTLFSDLTLFGDGAASVIRGPTAGGPYLALFASTYPAVCSNVKIMNLRFDQQAAGVTFPFDRSSTPPCLPCFVVFANQTSNVVVQDCVFDTCFGANTVAFGSGSQARVIDCTFNFLALPTPAGKKPYDNSAVYVEGANHIISGNFMRNSVWPPLAYPATYAAGAMETHAGPSVVFGNVSDGYLTGVNVGSAGASPALPYASDPTPSDMTIHGNTYRNSCLGIQLWPVVDPLNDPPTWYTTLRNVTVVGNTVSLAQIEFNSGALQFPGCAGIAVNQNDGLQSGPVEGLLIAHNHISFEPQDPTAYAVYDIYGIGCSPPPPPTGLTPPGIGAMVKNCAVSGNVVKNAPSRGIDVGHPGTTVSNTRVSGNLLVDAGQALNASQSAVRAALCSAGASANSMVTLEDVLIDDNQIADDIPPGATRYSFVINYQSSSTRLTLEGNRVIGSTGSSLTYDIWGGNDPGARVLDGGGSTALRPGTLGPYPAQRWEMYFDTGLGKPIWYNGAAWVDRSGTLV